MAEDNQDIIRELQERLGLVESTEDLYASMEEMQDSITEATQEQRDAIAQMLRDKKSELDSNKKTTKELDKQSKLTDKIANAYGRISESIKATFTGERVKETIGSIADTLDEKAAVGAEKIKTAIAGWAPRLASALTIASGGLLIAISAIALLVGGLVQQFIKVDEAVASVVKTSGILDNTLGATLIQATNSSGILGGNLEFAAEAANELINQLSPAIPLTSKLVGNVAIVSERFGLGVETATKFARIVSEQANVSIEEASDRTTDLIEGLGRLGPAVVRNISESYETVINSFGIGLEQLRQQGLAATQLGISLENAAEVSKGLLDISSSIQSEFKASALLGEQLNLQRARQLAFEGDIVGANREILDQVEQLGDLSQFNTFQRQALAEATGKTVAELQRELQIRKQIGRVGRIEEAQRRSVLTRFEAISRRISGAFFRVVSSPEIQNLIDTIATGIIDFLEGPRFQLFVSSLADLVETLGKLIIGDLTLDPLAALFGGSFVQKNTTKVTRINDGIITNKGEVVSTDPKDYIIATQNPAELVNGGGSSNSVMQEVRDLLKHLKENGVKAGDTFLDGKRVNKKLANAGR